ncbi:MAG: hypothetical protein IPQ03_00045 [Bacteroidetes bacterium]|nr:hypothetical protein [Bacteroidota bacterium]
MKTDNVYQIQENFIDLSKIKTFKLTKHYSNDKEKRRIEIELKDRIQFVNGKRDDMEIINDKIEIIFPNEISAQEACNELSAEWEKFIRDHESS